jgi:hypothetical protein
MNIVHPRTDSPGNLGKMHVPRDHRPYDRFPNEPLPPTIQLGLGLTMTNELAKLPPIYGPTTIATSPFLARNYVSAA